MVKEKLRQAAAFCQKEGAHSVRDIRDFKLVDEFLEALEPLQRIPKAKLIDELTPSQRRQSELEARLDQLRAESQQEREEREEREAKYREQLMAAFPERSKRSPGMRGFGMAAAMLHPLNGRVDFALHAGELVKKDAAYSIRLTPALVMAMLRRENELRLSEDVQASYGASGCLATFVSITERVQRQVVGEFGFEGEEAVSAALDGIRGCEALWPERAAEFRELSHYRKFNRARGGELSALDRVPDVPLGSLAATGEETDTSLAAGVEDDEAEEGKGKLLPGRGICGPSCPE